MVPLLANLRGYFATAAVSCTISDELSRQGAALSHLVQAVAGLTRKVDMFTAPAEPQLSLGSVPDSISLVVESEAPSGGPDRDSEAPSRENDGEPVSEALSRERGVYDRAEGPSTENQEKNARSYAAVTASGSPRKSSQTGKNPWSLAAQIKQRNVSVIRGNRKTASSLQGVESKRDFMDFFVGHLYPASTEDTLREFLRDVGITPVSAICAAIPSARVHLCTSPRESS